MRASGRLLMSRAPGGQSLVDLDAKQMQLLYLHILRAASRFPSIKRQSILADIRTEFRAVSGRGAGPGGGRVGGRPAGPGRARLEHAGTAAPRPQGRGAEGAEAVAQRRQSAVDSLRYLKEYNQAADSKRRDTSMFLSGGTVTGTRLPWE